MRTGGDVARERGRDASQETDGELVIDQERAADTELVLEQVTTREAADRWHEIDQECFEADYYEIPAKPVQEIYERIESIRSDDRYELWLACLRAEAGAVSTPVVLGEMRLPLLDNIDNAVVNVSTRPAFRQRGYGTAMLHHLTARAQAHGRTRLIGEVGEPLPPGKADDPSPPREADDPSPPREADDPSPPREAGYPSPTSPPGVIFAVKAGARPVTTEIRRLLRVSEIDGAHLSRLKDDAIAHSANYSLIQWEGSAPAEFIDDLAILHSRMTIDAPLEELDWEPEQWSPERYREREQRIAASGQVSLCTAARHDLSGRIVALTEIGLEAAPPEIAYQWATIVLPSHRGHRLGMLVKLANLEFLRTSRPLVEMVNTWNAGINDHMVGINEAIGFRAVERWREWQLELSSPTS
jgi:GNAT superfamily N-acetyltransferase